MHGTTKPNSINAKQAGDIYSYNQRLLLLLQLQVAFATEPVWARNPDSQPTKVYPSRN